MTDTAGRLSLANIMAVWGTAQGLKEEHVKSALQEHSASDKGQRFTTTMLHNDLYIEVSQSTKDKARNTHQSNAYRAIGAPRPPKRRRYS